MNKDEALSATLRALAPHDELLHSFLLRTMLTYDPTIKPVGVISDSGHWVEKPFVNGPQQHLFRNYSDHLLLETIDINKSINGRRENLFDSPTSYANSVGQVFFSTQKTVAYRKGREGIRYCIQCIREGISSFGYGYFRNFWYHSNSCLIHGRPLKEINSKNPKDTIRGVRKLLKGIEIKDSRSLVQLDSNIENTNISQSTNIMDRYYFPIKAAPCLLRVFGMWLLNNVSNFSEVHVKDIASKVISRHFFNQLELGDFKCREDFSIVYLLCSNYDPQLLEGFYAEYVDFFDIETGPRKQGILKEVYSKCRNQVCSECEYPRCPIEDKKNPPLIDNSQFDFKSLIARSYTLVRISQQGRPIARLCDNPWSPLKVEGVSISNNEFELITIEQ